MLIITSVKPLFDYNVRISFNTGEDKVVDLSPLLHGPIFEKISQDPAYFRTVQVDEESGTIGWDNGADIDPYVLYGSHQPAWQDEITIQPATR